MELAKKLAMGQRASATGTRDLQVRLPVTPTRVELNGKLVAITKQIVKAFILFFLLATSSAYAIGIASTIASFRTHDDFSPLLAVLIPHWF